jgi:putative transposase
LRWHREAFRFHWKRKSKAPSHKPKVAAETITLIREMATKNRLWGAERIRGELLKLGIHVCKRTIQKYRRQVRAPQPKGQKWATFLRNHPAQIWACDFFQVTDLFFRPLFAFVIIELKSRRVIHMGVTRSPTDPWVAQQLREATPYGQAPKYLIRDNDSKFGSLFTRVAATSAIEMLKIPYHAPQANAVCERFVRSVRQECLDHLLIFHEKQHKPRAKSRMQHTSIGHDRIKGFSSRFPNCLDHLIPLPTREPRCLRFRSWLGCTMTTDWEPKERQTESTGQRSLTLLCAKIPVEALWPILGMPFLSAFSKRLFFSYA